MPASSKLQHISVDDSLNVFKLARCYTGVRCIAGSLFSILSASAIYGHLKELGQVEPYDRRAATWKTARYEVWRRNLMWGSDWSKLSVVAVLFEKQNRLYRHGRMSIRTEA